MKKISMFFTLFPPLSSLVARHEKSFFVSPNPNGVVSTISLSSTHSPTHRVQAEKARRKNLVEKIDMCRSAANSSSLEEI
jgi:hypothetical protein